jgi:hypothetical protein
MSPWDRDVLGAVRRIVRVPGGVDAGRRPGAEGPGGDEPPPGSSSPRARRRLWSLSRPGPVECPGHPEWAPLSSGWATGAAGRRLATPRRREGDRGRGDRGRGPDNHHNHHNLCKSTQPYITAGYRTQTQRNGGYRTSRGRARDSARIRPMLGPSWPRSPQPATPHESGRQNRRRPEDPSSASSTPTGSAGPIRPHRRGSDPAGVIRSTAGIGFAPMMGYRYHGKRPETRVCRRRVDGRYALHPERPVRLDGRRP